MKTFKIEIRCDHEEISEFKNYLESLGHEVTISDSTESFVDGYPAHSELAPIDYMQLWANFCNQPVGPQTGISKL